MALVDSKDNSSEDTIESHDWTFIVSSGIDLEEIMRKFWWRFIPETQTSLSSDEVEKTPVGYDAPLLPIFTGLRFKLGEDRHTH